jgi:predicted acyl esterase
VAVSAGDVYPVNFATSTGKNNRWATELNLDILYPDRSGEDSKLLVYTGAPLATDVEVSGSPRVVLEVASTAKDGAFFAHLETLRPMGRSLIWMRENSAQSTASRWRRTSVRTIRLAQPLATPAATPNRFSPESPPN